MLDHFQIKNHLVSLHKFNELEKVSELSFDLKQGKDVAIITDAGVPCVSDPGAKVLNCLMNSEINFAICPINCGPAFIHAQIMSGFEAKGLEFLGFLDKKPQQLKNQFLNLTNLTDKLVIFYESVHRIQTTINILSALFAKNCQVAVVREITKLNEEIIVGDLKEVSAYINSPEFVQKGEFCVVLDKNLQPQSNAATSVDYLKLLDELILQGVSRKEAVKEIAKKYGLNKNELYQKSLNFLAKT
ncbi:SAM-dependent methyltransferase [Spiroplasma clarkii]|uniref:SAM-dependent methyltransferase n=1 Tax=Spiroplasma clarkii TaxID=2139 RepID=UPI0011BA55B3|nr:SAM-dependent methyltransferase [Spiroplasma clarkii]